MNDLVPIGRFSTICRLSRKALRLYDEAGLLRPALVDARSGYRYYGLSQALEAERIRALRALEVPLDEIAAILRAPDAAAARVLLERHSARLAARVDAYRGMIEALDRLAREEPARYEVRTKENAPQQVLSIRVRAPLPALAVEGPRAFAALGDHLARARARPAGSPFALWHGPEFDEAAVDVEWCVPVDRPVSGHGAMSGRELPAETVAYTLHAGPYDRVGPAAYAALQGWMHERGREGDGPPREVYLVGPCEARDPADYRTELQWPIR